MGKDKRDRHWRRWTSPVFFRGGFRYSTFLVLRDWACIGRTRTWGSLDLVSPKTSPALPRGVEVSIALPVCASTTVPDLTLLPGAVPGSVNACCFLSYRRSGGLSLSSSSIHPVRLFMLHIRCRRFRPLLLRRNTALVEKRSEITFIRLKCLPEILFYNCVIVNLKNAPANCITKSRNE